MSKLQYSLCSVFHEIAFLSLKSEDNLLVQMWNNVEKNIFFFFGSAKVFEVLTVCNQNYCFHNKMDA